MGLHDQKDQYCRRWYTELSDSVLGVCVTQPAYNFIIAFPIFGSLVHRHIWFGTVRLASTVVLSCRVGCSLTVAFYRAEKQSFHRFWRTVTIRLNSPVRDTKKTANVISSTSLNGFGNWRRNEPTTTETNLLPGNDTGAIITHCLRLKLMLLLRQIGRKQPMSFKFWILRITMWCRFRRVYTFPWRSNARGAVRNTSITSVTMLCDETFNVC